jgi:hypothetical protein
MSDDGLRGVIFQATRLADVDYMAIYSRRLFLGKARIQGVEPQKNLCSW